MDVFKNAKWIWVDGNAAPNTYGEFYDEFVWQGDKAVCRISADSDYTLFINGKYVASNQYGDFPWYKSYDELDVTPYLTKGKNKIAVLVWYFGESTQRYYAATPGVLYEVVEGGTVCVESGENTLSRYSLAYKNGLRKNVTKQLGFSYLYDATKETDWINGDVQGFTPSVLADKDCNLVPRPVKKGELLAPKKGKLIDQASKTYYLYDLGEEVVGLLSFAIRSSVEQKITVAFGEHIIKDGKVSRFIHDRDFSVEYVAKAGKNEYTNYMLRLGCRYLQVECDGDIEVDCIAVIPQVYPATFKAFTAKSEQDKAIYELCLNSLRLCMMEHYVDCPWREQCLYAFDSRNQMLCGYYAFEDGNFEYARANLLLMAQDKCPSGLMAICYPCGLEFSIPSFSLYYALSVKEYIEHSGDTSLAKEVYPRIRAFMDVMLAQRKDGLLYRFEGEKNWNFYDWSPYSEGTLHSADAVIADAQLNILAIMALNATKRICELGGIAYPYENAAEELSANVVKTFYNEEKQAFSVTKGGDEYVELVNALAVAFDVVSGEKAEIICEKIAKGELISSSLSMKCFTYDALLKVSEEKYRDFILSEIRRDYQLMIDSGSSAAWETIDGAAAFDHAGSLCHGWSAIPVYYYKKFKIVE